MKKCIILLIIIFIISILIFSITYEIQALGLENIVESPGAYVGEPGGNERIIPIGRIILSVVRTVGTAISVLMLTIIGIKYVMGSVQEKADYKQTMWPYVVGAVLIFAGANLVDIIYKAFK